MHGIQMLLVIGGVMLLGFLSLTFYRTMSNQDGNVIHNSVVIDATAVGQSVMAEIENKAFDEMTKDSTVTNPLNLTPSLSFGPELGETYPFDDIDDFNNYSKKDTVADIGVFSTRVSVKYVQTMSPDNTTNNSTFSKGVYLFITNSLISDTVKLARVFSY